MREIMFEKVLLILILTMAQNRIYKEHVFEYTWLNLKFINEIKIFVSFEG